MGWILRLVETGVEGPLGSVDVLEIDRPGNLDDLADLGLRLPDGKQLLSQVQQAVVASPMPGSCRPTAGMPGLRCRMPGQRQCRSVSKNVDGRFVIVGCRGSGHVAFS